MLERCGMLKLSSTTVTGLGCALLSSVMVGLVSVMLGVNSNNGAFASTTVERLSDEENKIYS